jgi:hypothetical protein
MHRDGLDEYGAIDTPPPIIERVEQPSLAESQVRHHRWQGRMPTNQA